MLFNFNKLWVSDFTDYHQYIITIFAEYFSFKVCFSASQ